MREVHRSLYFWWGSFLSPFLDTACGGFGAEKPLAQRLPQLPCTPASSPVAPRCRPAAQHGCSCCNTQQHFTGWGQCYLTPLAATSQAAHEELWPGFAPCRRVNRLVPQCQLCQLPPANTNPFQSRSEACRACSPIPLEGSREAKAADGGSHAPLQAWVPLGHLQESTKPRQNRLENRLDPFMEEKSPLKTIKHTHKKKKPLEFFQC